MLCKNNLATIIGEADGSKTEYGKVAWVRPKTQTFTTDYKTAFIELSAYVRSRHLCDGDDVISQITKDLTKQAERTAYMRGYWTKEKQ